LTTWKYSGVGFVPEPNAGALGGVADEFNTGCFECGADESEVCFGSLVKAILRFYST
jgi:hypothetical protein